MRDIEFRGKRVDGGEWLHGKLLDLVINEQETLPAIRTFCQVPCPYDYMQPVLGWEDFVVNENTVGQFTGLKDKNGKEIYEGDILQEKGTTLWTVGWAVYNTEMGFFTFGIDRRFHKPLTKSRLFNAEVIGNIYDNPELLEGDNK